MTQADTSAAQLTAMLPHLGARIDGMALGGGLSAATVGWILDRLAERKVLVFPGQRLNAEHFHAFARLFGRLQQHVLRKYRHKDFPELSWLTNVADDGSVDMFGVRRATTWYSDGSYSQEPPALGILYALEVPRSGGGTLFADMCYAYRRLGERDRKQAAGLTGLHRHGAGPGGEMYDDSLDDDQAEGFEDAVHPLVGRHPRSGEPLLYVNETHTRRFAELDVEQSRRLVKALVREATVTENVYEHRWAKGDLLMWDQAATIHRGAGDYPPEQRRVKLRAIVQELR